MFRESLESVLNQKNKNFKLIISDNSIGNETSILVSEHYPNVSYIRRKPTLSAIDHGIRIINECTSEYIVIFHDDDMMEDVYTERMIDLIAEFPDAAAIGCNARLLHNGEIAKTPYMRRRNRQILIPNTDYLAKTYLGICSELQAPFPSYIYKTAIARRFYSKEILKEGKYSDFSFLMHIQEHSSILWVPDILMTYRLHGGNDSHTESISHRLALLRLVYSKTSITPRDMAVIEYKFRFYLNLVSSKSETLRSKHPRRYRIIIKFLVANGLLIATNNLAFWDQAKNKLNSFVRRIRL